MHWIFNSLRSLKTSDPKRYETRRKEKCDMANHKIKCEVIDILKNEFNCSKKGQTFVLGARTPEGMCAKAFATIYPTALAMRFSDSIAWENDKGYLDITCPDQDVVYRLSRIEE